MAIISTRIHGILDYATAGLMVVLAGFAGWGSVLSWVLLAFAVTITAISLTTNYELGVFRILPMTAHLALDYLMGGLLLVAAFLAGSGAGWIQAVLVMLAVAEFGVALITNPVPAEQSPVEAGTAGRNRAQTF